MATRRDLFDDRQRYVYKPTSPPETLDPVLRDWLRREFDAVRKGLVDPHRPDSLQRDLGTLQGDVDTLYADLVGVWDDWKFPATRDRQGAASKPDYDFTNLGLLFPRNDPGEEIAMTDQVPHEWMQGTEMHPHVHYIQDEAQIPIFTLEWRIYANGGTVPSFAAIDTTGVLTFPYTSGAIVQILKFPAISPPAGSTSAIADFRLYRDDDVVAGDVLLKSFDIHYQIDSNGSQQEYTK